MNLRRQIPPGGKLRALVVDDSVVIRRLVSHALSEDPEIEVVGAAPDGVIALARIPQLNPHVVTLDIEMPRMDGLATLREIRKQYPDIIVIMFSTLTERGAYIIAQDEASSVVWGMPGFVSKGGLADATVSLQAVVPKILGHI
jgi:chemotaxis response regulator CheB